MKILFSIGLIFASLARAHAGDFFEKDGFAIDGYDAVSFFESSGPIKGTQAISVTFRGSVFLFSSEDHKKEFLKNPEKYSPQFNGYCAFGLARGYKAKSEPGAFSVVKGKLYLNYDLLVRKKWLEKRDDFIEKAEANWPSVKSTTKVYR